MQNINWQLLETVHRILLRKIGVSFTIIPFLKATIIKDIISFVLNVDFSRKQNFLF